MPWATPTLKEVRGFVRDAVRGRLPGADANIGNSVLRVVSDVQGALCHLTLQYVDWLSKQLLPDTAETEWLDRHGDIWLTNADGTTGRKMATLAVGTVTVTASTSVGIVVPKATRLIYSGTEFQYETMNEIFVELADVPTPVEVRAIDAGAAGNLDAGTTLGFVDMIDGLTSAATVVILVGGADEETDDQLRLRVLERIQNPPMGGDQEDYVNWTLRVPGVTRAWCSPLEMGMGTVTVRFMMDDLRADNGGFPLPGDIEIVRAYLDTVRPVAVKDFFVESPIPYPIDLRIKWLDLDRADTRAAIIESLKDEFFERTKPGQTWYRAWTDAGIMSAAGVNAYDLVADDVVMPSLGHMPVLGTVRYG